MSDEKNNISVDDESLKKYTIQPWANQQLTIRHQVLPQNEHELHVKIGDDVEHLTIFIERDGKKIPFTVEFVD